MQNKVPDTLFSLTPYFPGLGCFVACATGGLSTSALRGRLAVGLEIRGGQKAAHRAIPLRSPRLRLGLLCLPFVTSVARARPGHSGQPGKTPRIGSPTGVLLSFSPETVAPRNNSSKL